MDLGIAGRVALVGASSRGLGRAAARALASEGAQVAICGRDADSLAATAGELRGAGAEVLAVECDITEPSSPARLVTETVERFGRLDIVVPNAGGPPPGGALDIEVEQIATAVNANLLTSVRLVKEALPHLLDGGWGRICCITSYSVVQPVPYLSLSNTARAGLWAWAKTAASDLSGRGVTINLACPGPHATDRMLQLGGGDPSTMGDPADFGRVVAFLCSEPARFVNGAAIVVDGGATLAL
jgi:3-oxoacyl-[acyl-carrier protein] reductase